MLELRALGGLALHGAESAQPKRLALLCYLTLAGSRSFHRRDSLVALFWPELDEAHARQALRQALTAIRALDEHLIVTRSDEEVGIAPGALECDVVAFEQALAQGDLVAALGRYTGPFLDGFFLDDCPEFERWVDAERTRLSGLAAGAAWELAGREQVPAAAVRWARRAAGLQPDDEGALRRLVTILDRAGDRAGALREYEAFAHRLREQYQVEPAPETQALVAEVRERRALTRAQIAGSTGEPSDRGAGIEAASAPRVGRTRVGAGLAAALIVVLVGFFVWRRQVHPPMLDPDVIAVLPFRVSAPDSALNYLREGVVDLLNGRLTGEGMPRAVDSRTTLARWRRAAAAAGGEPTAPQALGLARALGAGQLLVGEVVATPVTIQVNGRLLRVPTGEVVAEHAAMAARGKLDEITLVDRVLVDVLALSAGEAKGRLAGLSDSLEAIRSYLAGMRSYRQGQYERAIQLFSRALETDSTFAAAALWRTYATSIGSSPLVIRAAGSAAWSLRNRLGPRDRAALATDWAIGPNYPEPYTTEELIRAADVAAQTNPDRPEAWFRLGLSLGVWGGYSSINGWRDRAARALDSALALDSTFGPAIEVRLWVALEARDSTAMRRFGSLYFAANPDGQRVDAYRWLVARALNDTAGLKLVWQRIPSVTDLFSVSFIQNFSVVGGFPLDDAERGLRARLAAAGNRPLPTSFYQTQLIRNAIIRGRVRKAIARADSVPTIGRRSLAQLLITAAIVDSGYGGQAQNSAVYLDRLADTTSDAEAEAGAVCYAALWRVFQGDTATTRRSAARTRRVVQSLDPGSFPRVGRLQVCPLLLEAALEQSRGAAAPSRALDRLDALMRRGTGYELPGNLANLMVARWREKHSDYASALAAVRRRTGSPILDFIVLVPAYLREEGRLAELTGDTVAAVRAYRDYLTLRDDPDPGAIEREVQGVQTRLAGLLRQSHKR